MDETDQANHKEDPIQHNAFLSALNSIDKGLGWIEKTIISTSILLMALLMSAHVVGGLLFNKGIPGTYEVTEMLIIVITFVGVGYAARCARHIRMSAIYDMLSDGPRKVLMIILSIGTAVLMFYFAYKSAQYDIALYGRGRVSSSLNIPLWTVNLALPIGFTLAGIQYILVTLRNLFSEGIYRSFTEKEEFNELPLDDSGESHMPDGPMGP